MEIPQKGCLFFLTGIPALRAAAISAVLFVIFIWTAGANADQFISAGDVNFGEVGEMEFVAGQAYLPMQAVSWRSETSWRITVRSLDSTLGPSEDGAYTKPLGDLEWKVSTRSQWNKMRQSEETVETGSPGDGNVYMDYRVKLSWNKDRPGNYRTVLRFTISEL